MSQRLLAKKAGIAYKSLQLIEVGGHDPKLSTLSKIAMAINYPKGVFNNFVSQFFSLPQNSIAIVSREIVLSKNKKWQIPLFDFVDQFRKNKDPVLISEPPCNELPQRLKALLASTVEALCAELAITKPWWCDGIESLGDPYFVAEVENLKALTLIESSVYFRKRNIFVLENFLERA
ncbi:helix-turn-helix domain-containing protein [bacterium]|nr:helix-turn-helix domain-containing protein [bacterium]MBU1918715.1 helix-turn-helix domain-containing protein [bacterium]